MLAGRVDTLGNPLRENPLMINARHALMKIALELAEKNLHSLSLLIVSPSDHGKTDTLRLFAQEHDGVWMVRPASASRIVDDFRRLRNIAMVAIDEPYDWIAADYKNAAMLCKHIIEGKIKAPRSTVYTTSVDMTKPAATAVVLLCNDVQYDIVRRSLGGCGLLERSLTIMVQNSNPDTQDYIEDYYRSHPFDTFHHRSEFTFCQRDPTPEEKQFIDRHFNGYVRRSMMWIARVTPEKVFANLKPYLVSGLNGEFVEEEIEFEERDKT